MYNKGAASNTNVTNYHIIIVESQLLWIAHLMHVQISNDDKNSSGNWHLIHLQSSMRIYSY